MALQKPKFQLHKNCEILVSGISSRADVEEYTRGGSRSPSDYIIIYRGKRYVRYAAKRACIELPLHTFLRFIYSRVNLAELIYAENPFLAMLKKDSKEPVWLSSPLEYPIRSE